MRKLVIFSGGDRVGKSTLISGAESALKNNCSTFHHSAPPQDQVNIFDMYREHVEEWLETGNEWCLFDRAYPCSFILEDHRRRNHGHLDDVIDLELEWLGDDRFDVIHVAIERPWNWSAKHHLIELKEMFPEAAPWFIRDEYVARMKEHKHYYERLYEFYTNVSAFPHHVHHGWHFRSTEHEVKDVIANIKHILNNR